MKLEATFRNGFVEVTSSSVEDETSTFFVEVHPLEAQHRKSLAEALAARLRESSDAFIYMDAPMERVVLLEPATMIAPLFERTDKVTMRHPESTLPGHIIGPPLVPPSFQDVLERAMNMDQLLNMAKPQNQPYKHDLSGEPKTPKRSWGAKRLRRWRKKGSP